MPGGGKGGSSSTVTVNNGPITVDSDSTVAVNGLDNIGLNARIEPLAIESTIKVPDPIVTKSSSDTKADITTTSAITTKSDVASDSKNAIAVDLKPVVLDVCSTTSTKLPQGEIIQPFHLHFGVTMFGMEMLGFNLAGEQRTVLKKLPKKPAVEWPAQRNAPTPPPAADVASTAATGGRPGGLRIRIK
jgi:hypothetical protein